jgi:sigma-B regulation protein RsbU (phosphoserine phosphatase)
MALGDPESIEGMMSRLNNYLLERTRGEKYATVFYCTVDGSGRLSYANAGHCAPFLVARDGRLGKLNTTGMPVGMLEDTPVEKVEVQLAPGDKIVIFSDGLTDMEDAEGRFFGNEGIRLCVRENFRQSAAALHEALRRTVDRFSEGGVVRDDITMLVLEYLPGA